MAAVIQTVTQKLHHLLTIHTWTPTQQQQLLLLLLLLLQITKPTSKTVIQTCPVPAFVCMCYTALNKQHKRNHPVNTIYAILWWDNALWNNDLTTKLSNSLRRWTVSSVLCVKSFTRRVSADQSSRELLLQLLHTQLRWSIKCHHYRLHNTETSLHCSIN